MDETPTIFALSSAPGRAGIAVVRVSGPRAGDVIDALSPPRPKKRLAALRRVRDPAAGETLDSALVLWFAAPRTETGEDMAEFHLHGGPAIVKAVLGVLARQPGCRLAEPGEFARRSFAAGKLDLAEVEGLADLIDAETEVQRRQALSQMQGALSDLYGSWRAELIRASALVEAVIDFSDEADVASEAFELARGIVGRLQTAIAAHLDDGNRGEILRDGFRVVLAGPPNVGKSSLLNALAKRDAAIVSDEAGTTRDVVEVRLDLAGYPVIVSDTAGIREPQGAIEREGIRRTLAHARDADLVVWLSDAGAPDETPPPEIAARGDTFFMVVANKIDLPEARTCPEVLAVSAKTGAGIDALTRRIGDIARDRVGISEAPAITRVRYREHLNACISALHAFMSGMHTDTSGLPGDIELCAEDLRQAATALGRITGRVDVEDVLGEIFGRFCVGK
jgi:tRNA modification GTPase